MSIYPRKVGPVFECPVCRAVYRYAEYAHGCCPVPMYERGYECGSETCGLEGIHVREEDARRCMEQAVSDD